MLHTTKKGFFTKNQGTYIFYTDNLKNLLNSAFNEQEN